jgi:hypothetical protein
MSVAATMGNEYTLKDWNFNRKFRRVQLLVTGLANGANTIPHGLKSPNSNPPAGVVPKEAIYVPTSAVVGHEAADATYVYYTVDSGAGTTMSVWVTV